MGDRVGALRRKLDALAYAETLEPGSAALAERLLADLVATTESWRALKLRDAARGQQLAAFQAQARAHMPVKGFSAAPGAGAVLMDHIAPQRAGTRKLYVERAGATSSITFVRFDSGFLLKPPLPLTPNLCAQLEALRRDEGRLASESAALRAALLAAEEAADAAARRHGEETRGLEARVAELLFWKSRTVERHSTLEQARCLEA